MPRSHLTFPICFLLPTLLAASDPPAPLRPWLETKQDWVRDTDRAIVSLGEPGQFDDTHIFAPTVARDEEGGGFRLWYCGSTGTVAKRVFRMGLATSRDDRSFTRHPKSPVYDFGDGRHSVLTPSVLRDLDGRPVREKGKLRMWFSSTWFEEPGMPHALFETASADGLAWDPPSQPLLRDCYAPSVLKSEAGNGYHLWYTDVSGEPWIIRHASSPDGRKWKVTPDPCLLVDQDWEKQNLFYPHVIRIGEVYLMWYGSYWTGRPDTTSLGLAASIDGKNWFKAPGNPVFRPDPERPWESHYVTSHTVVRDPADGSLRLFYASRKAPPFLNKYFALNTAVWKNPPEG